MKAVRKNEWRKEKILNFIKNEKIMNKKMPKKIKKNE